MDRLQFRPAPDPQQRGPEQSDRLLFPSLSTPHRLWLQDDEVLSSMPHQPDPMQDSGLWMDAPDESDLDNVFDHAQHRLNNLRALLDDASPDDDGPRAA